MNEGSLIAPIGSLHRYLAEANDSILNHPSDEEAQDRVDEIPSIYFNGLSETNNNSYKTQTITNIR